jgi:hypothetical protein
MQANSEIKTLSSVSSLPTAQLVQYVQTLPLHQKQSIFDTLQQDPEVKESRSVLPYKSPLPLAKGYCNKPHPSSSRDIAPFFKQCYDNICTGKVDEKLLDDVLDVVLLRVDEAFTPTKVEEVKQAMRQWSDNWLWLRGESRGRLVRNVDLGINHRIQALFDFITGWPMIFDVLKRS